MKFMYKVILSSAILYSIFNHTLFAASMIPKIIAHRGAWKEYNLPQNSIASLKKAIELGCYGTEFDVQMTKDSILVINHDNDYNGLLIESHTYEELAVHRLSNGEKLPTLATYLEVASHYPIKLMCEIKTSSIDKKNTKNWALQSLRLINKYKMNAQVEFILFDYDATIYISKQTKIPVSYLMGDQSPNDIKSNNINGIDYNFNVFKKYTNYLAQAKKLGLKTNVWTVNEVEDLLFFKNQCIDYITTDIPEKALKLMKQ